MNDYSPEFFDPTNQKIKITLTDINDAIENDKILEFKVAECTPDRTLKMNFDNNVTGIIPFSELEYNLYKKELHEKTALFKVGKHIKFKVMSVEDKDGISIVTCSRRLAQKECYDNYISKLIPGDVINAKIINFEKYGLFCDIGCGIPSLLPFGHISVVNTKNPELLLHNKENIRVVVRTTIGKIVLSHRELLGTWEQEASKLHRDQIIHGIVVNKQPYGTFVKVSQNLSGLADSNNSLDNISVGDYVKVQVTSINIKGMKVKLSILSKDDEEQDDEEFNYYYEPGDHIEKWKYTTDDYHKVIGTDFTRTNTDMVEYMNNRSKHGK